MPEIRRISMSSDFLLEDLKNRKISIYLCLPLNAVSCIEQRWLRMFVLLTVDMMTRVNKAPSPPILLAIDEFPSLGKLDGIETVAPTMRSVGVRLWVIGQDLEQFEKVYPESWGGFIGGAEAVQFMGITHPPTVAFIAERLGQHVVVDRQKMGEEVREIPSERPLRDPDQIARMLAKDSKNQIVWRASARCC
jgi:type IV secretion system protein VirD4